MNILKVIAVSIQVEVGTISERAKKLMSDLYTPLVRQVNPVIFMDERSCKLMNYSAKSFLTIKISFLSHIAQLRESMGAGIYMVRIGIGSDDRSVKRFLILDIGYGALIFISMFKHSSSLRTKLNYTF